jgi:hypothetical protein
MKPSNLLTLGACLVLGCTGPPFLPVNVCAPGEMTVNAARRISCSGAEAMVARGDQALVASGLFTSADFARSTSDLTVWLWPDAQTIPDSPCEEATGCLLFGHAEVYLADHGASFTHELMHRLDELRGVSDDANRQHLGWGQRGAPAGAATHDCQPWAQPPCLDGSWEDVAYTSHVEQAFAGVTEGL